MLSGCRNVSVYEKLGYCGEGTYGKVFKAREKETGGIYALKKVAGAGAAGRGEEGGGEGGAGRSRRPRPPPSARLGAGHTFGRRAGAARLPGKRGARAQLPLPALHRGRAAGPPPGAQGRRPPAPLP
jgi:hypothetical protein